MATRAPVRVLVLEPSVPRRHRLQRLVEGDPTLQVVGATGQVHQALEAAERDHVEVILLGQGHALADTVASTRRIMQARATPIVALTATTGPQEAKESFALIEAGALVVLRDPGSPASTRHDEERQQLLTTLRMMSEVRVVRRWAAMAGGPARAAANVPARQLARAGARKVHSALVAIGASTGGPVALRQLLGALPPDFPVPILIVQHMADGFLQGMAQWLSGRSSVRVAIATPGTEPRPGHAYLAPDGMHMRVAADGRLVLDDASPVNGHRPAVSCLLASAADHYGSRAIGVLLTGMGKDGAAELKRMKDAGAVTIAQDEASSVVHGMPGEAIRCGGATYVMSPEEIAAALPALILR